MPLVASLGHFGHRLRRVMRRTASPGTRQIVRDPGAGWPGVSRGVQALLEEGLDLVGRDRLREREDELAIQGDRVGRPGRLGLDEQEADGTLVLVDVQGKRVVDRVIDPCQLERRRIEVLDLQRVLADRLALGGRSGLGADEEAGRVDDVDVDIGARHVLEVDLDRHGVGAIVGRRRRRPLEPASATGVGSGVARRLGRHGRGRWPRRSRSRRRADAAIAVTTAAARRAERRRRRPRGRRRPQRPRGG